MTEIDLFQDTHPELTWEEHVKLMSRAMRSWRFFSIVVSISLLLMFTVGLVFQILFVFSFIRAFFALAIISQSFYSAFLRILKDDRLPPQLTKPPKSAFATSAFYLLIAVFFFLLGIYILQLIGFRTQSLGYFVVLGIQSIVNSQ